MENKDSISRRVALKRMSKAALAFAVATIFPSAEAFASDPKYSNYRNYNNYGNYGNYFDYKNYQDYSNYDNYKNYQNYQNCH